MVTKHDTLIKIDRCLPHLLEMDKDAAKPGYLSEMDKDAAKLYLSLYSADTFGSLTIFRNLKIS